MRRIGQILSESIPLTQHDVAEILEEQKVSRQRFGDAAMALGLANPQQVWEAWIEQLQAADQKVDLRQIPFDRQAINSVPAYLALEHRLLPLRVRGDDIVLAAVVTPSDAVVKLIEDHCRKRCVIVLTNESELRQSLHAAYAPMVPAAA